MPRGEELLKLKSMIQVVLTMVLIIALSACNSSTSNVTEEISQIRWTILEIYQKEHTIREEDIPLITAEFVKVKEAHSKLKEPIVNSDADYSTGYNNIFESAEYFLRTYPERPYDNIFLQALEYLQSGIFYLEESQK